MPALVNISVGSLRGTSGDDATTAWSLRAKIIEEALADVVDATHRNTPLVPSPPCAGPASDGPSRRRAAGAVKCPSGLKFCRLLFSGGGSRKSRKGDASSLPAAGEGRRAEARTGRSARASPHPTAALRLGGDLAGHGDAKRTSPPSSVAAALRSRVPTGANARTQHSNSSGCAGRRFGLPGLLGRPWFWLPWLPLWPRPCLSPRLAPWISPLPSYPAWSHPRCSSRYLSWRTSPWRALCSSCAFQASGERSPDRRPGAGRLSCQPLPHASAGSPAQ